MLKRKTRGFTLIELLVVIAIIGILSSVVLASLNTARTKARDAQRMQTVKSLKTAIELYATTNGVYPQYGSEGTGYAVSNLSAYLVPTHIQVIAPDPQGQTNYYVWGPNGASYGLWIYTEARAGWCLTGMSVNTGWWGAGTAGLCSF